MILLARPGGVEPPAKSLEGSGSRVFKKPLKIRVFGIFASNTSSITHTLFIAFLLFFTFLFSLFRSTLRGRKGDETMAKRQKTSHKGVTVYTPGNGEKIYYIRYYLGGKQIEECAGSAWSGMTPAKAAIIRAEKMAGKVLTNAKAREQGDVEKWTLRKLFDVYQSTLPEGEGRKVDARNFKRWQHVEEKEPGELHTAEVEAVKKRLEKERKSAQTIKHVVTILSRTINFGVKTGRIPQPNTQKLYIVKPKLDLGKHIETMTDEQLHRYLTALDAEPDQLSVNILRFALVTGMRKTAILNLKWSDIDFINSNITLRGEVSKKRKTDYIKMNASARNILKNMKENGYGSEYVFAKPDGEKRKDLRRIALRVREKAGLPKNFRPLHGLRHTFASRMISSGQVNLDQLQELLTHETAAMTRVYAKFSDEAKQAAANAADSVMNIGQEK
ncbi:tyrosine-type recombinase/integrase [Desulfovibrio falkowii]|uniref:tyrosine-type recombinase/integrase n=1 Tax=Desulfovibrio sp. WGS1351 TaxID=3366814 RepID=UPI00372D11B4